MTRVDCRAYWSSKWREAAIDQFPDVVKGYEDSGFLRVDGAFDPAAVDVAAFETKRAAEKAAALAEGAEFDGIKRDNALRALVKASPAQIDVYVNENASNLAETRQLLKKMLRLIKVVAAREFQ